MLSSITRFLRDEEGATAIEYGIIAGLMAVVLVAAFGTGTNSIGGALKTMYSTIAGKLAISFAP